MIDKPRNLVQFCASAAVIFALLVSDLGAQEYAEQLRRPFWMQGRQLRQAFSEITKTPQRWTVKLFSESETVAYGTIISADGWIVTKGSQIQQATLCELPDGRRLPFTYVGFDISLDLALIQVETEGLSAVQWETDSPKLGAWLISVDTSSTPIGVGVMSVPRRKIPRSDVRGVLGIQLVIQDEPVIERVFPNSGGKAAGLQPGDQVLQVNDTKITGRRQLVETIGTYRPGDSILLKLIRNDETITVSATLTHPFGDFLSRIAFQEQMGGPLSFRRDDFPAVYQQDTVLAPEECGGPVVNLDGKAVGINIARAGRTATYVLPADLILEKIEDLKSGKSPPPIVERGTDDPEGTSTPSETSP